ncbi:unnamed protein product [Amaranthus hypochondriacus]
MEENSNSNSNFNRNSTNNNNKKLRRLPHVFSKVLELPFKSDADVFIQELPNCFKFTAQIEDAGIVLGDVKANVVRYHPGIIKIVIVRSDNPLESAIDELELDVWRFRLQPSARAEYATAVYAQGNLVVTVPKNVWGENVWMGDCKSGFKGNMGNLILVH